LSSRLRNVKTTDSVFIKLKVNVTKLQKENEITSDRSYLALLSGVLSSYYQQHYYCYSKKIHFLLLLPDSFGRSWQKQIYSGSIIAVFTPVAAKLLSQTSSRQFCLNSINHINTMNTAQLLHIRNVMTHTDFYVLLTVHPGTTLDK